MESVPENRILKLPAGAVENIRKIYNLDKIERLQEAIKLLEDWIKKQDHIIKKDFSKDYLERTLLTCKGSVEKSKKQIDRLCTMKTLMPKFFSKVNVKLELQNVLDIAWVTPLPELTEDYYRVLMIKFNNKDITSDLILQYFQYFIILTEYNKAHDYINGFIAILDCRECNLLEYVSKLNPVELQQCLSIIIDGYGARVKSIQLLTNSKTIEVLVNIIKHLVSEKISNRIYVQPTLEDLHKAVPKEILPIEYGGNEKSIEKLHAEYVEELSSEKHVEYMKMMNKACSDETKRHEGKFNEEYMGTPGAFRWATPLPKMTDDYYRILMAKFNNKDLTSDFIQQYFQYAVIVAEYMKTHDYPNGLIAIFDLRETNLFELVSKLNPVEVQQCLSIVIEGYGARVKSIQLITDSKAVEMLINILKLFVSEKIANRIYVHPTLEDLHKAVPKEILPVDYGGNEKPFEKLNEEFVEELSSEKHVEYMKMMNKACSDETKRNEAKFNEEYMGTPGAFRCLNVD